MSILDMVWNQLQEDLRAVRSDVDIARARTERAETAGGFTACAYGQLPLSGRAGDVYFVTNACKAGEAAGTGTGCPAYFNPADGLWYRFDDSVITI